MAPGGQRLQDRQGRGHRGPDRREEEQAAGRNRERLEVAFPGHRTRTSPPPSPPPMLDLKFIRQNPALVIEGARKKRITVDVDGLLAADSAARALQTEVDALRARQNALSK
ncbi:MAG: hypothetical protein ACK55I_18380, partial [bacterium]